MIIDGHAHIYPENNAEKIMAAFTQFHRMEPTASFGKGTAADLLSRLEASRGVWQFEFLSRSLCVSREKVV